ncbi:MAG TPA: type II secretion system protein N [Steroidobacteraceae bacterium]
MRRAIILAVTGFVLVLLLRFPARWISPLLPHGVHCQQLDGSVWSGSCAGFTNGAAPLGDLSWQLHPLQLLRARLGLHIDLTNQGSYLRGDVALGFGGAVHATDLSMDLPLSNALVSSLPAGAHARLSGKLVRIEWTGKFLSELQGEVDVQDFVASQGAALGSYQAIFAPQSASGSNDMPTAVVHDTGGPLALDATLQLNHDPGYLLEGRVAARPSASADIADMLKYFGSPDASGRRPFSLTGTF